MRIINKPVSELKPLPGNPNVMSEAEKEKLDRSLAEFGYVEPLVWNKQTGHVVGGNHRLESLRKSGETSIEVVEVDLSPAREKALAIALNKVHGEFDFTLLADMLIEIDTGEFDLEVTGFDEGELRAIADGPQLVEFPRYTADNIKTNRTCPKCGYEWSEQ